MKKNAGILFLMVLLSGCASVPFKAVPLSRVEKWDPQAVRQNFKNRIAEKYEVTESGQFQYGRRKFSLLAYTRADEAADTIASAGFTPVGMKVFELKTEGDKTESSFSLPTQVEKKVDLRKMEAAMAEDMRRVYFERVPPGNAVVSKKKDRIVYEAPSGPGTVQWVFGGPDQALIEKNYHENGKEIWRGRYFSYQTKDGKLYPDRVYYENFSRKYKLTLRLKEITA